MRQKEILEKSSKIEGKRIMYYRTCEETKIKIREIQGKVIILE